MRPRFLYLVFPLPMAMAAVTWHGTASLRVARQLLERLLLSLGMALADWSNLNFVLAHLYSFDMCHGSIALSIFLDRISRVSPPSCPRRWPPPTGQPDPLRPFWSAVLSLRCLPCWLSVAAASARSRLVAQDAPCHLRRPPSLVLGE